MNILLATTEAVPFAKTGGLADVAGVLPIELTRLGHSVVVIMPAFRQIHAAGVPIESTGLELEIPIGSKTVAGELLRSHLPDSEVPVYFVAQDDYYDRDELYRSEGEDYRDNCERFVFYCRAVLEAIRLLDLSVDLVHTNDWQTSLIPAYLKTEYWGVPGYEGIASLLTIHNMAYQGVFWHWDMVLTGLDWKYFNWRQMEFFGNLNLLKTGLAFADSINTVSPSYAKEIQSAPLGCGLEGILADRSDDLTGIINGVDYRHWNPATDPLLAANYDAKSFETGKPLCKAALQAELGLPIKPDTPLVGLIGRLVDQKGLDLVAGTITKWAHEQDVQWAILGTGEPAYHELLGRLAAQYPARVAARLEFSNELAHRIEAGADLFLMPSQFEPCGLNQLYSLKYGTVPLVRKTGGLADTIVGASESTLADGTASGFSFREYSEPALTETLSYACETYREQPEVWKNLIREGMSNDWSWSQSAQRYSELYACTVSRVKQEVCH